MSGINHAQPPPAVAPSHKGPGMKRLLIATLALSALSGAAWAQSAYTPGDGPPPDEYPMCTHRGQDRCMQPREWYRHHREHRHHHGDHGHSSTDGERG